MYKFSLRLTFIWNTMLMALLTFVGVFIVKGDWYLLDEGLRSTMNGLNIDKDWLALPLILIIFYIFIQVKIAKIWSCDYERTSIFVGIITLLTNPILGILILLFQPIILKRGKVEFDLCLFVIFVWLVTFLAFTVPLIVHAVFSGSLEEYFKESFRNNVSEYKKDMESYSTKEGLGNSNERLKNINKREVYNILEYGVYCGSGEKEQVKIDLEYLISITPTPSRKINDIEVLDRNIKTKFSNYKDEVDVTKTCWEVDADYKVLGNKR